MVGRAPFPGGFEGCVGVLGVAEAGNGPPDWSPPGWSRIWSRLAQAVLGEGELTGSGLVLGKGSRLVGKVTCWVDASESARSGSLVRGSGKKTVSLSVRSDELPRQTEMNSLETGLTETQLEIRWAN